MNESRYSAAIDEIQAAFRRASAIISSLDTDDPKQAERQRQLLLIFFDRVGYALDEMNDQYIESAKRVIGEEG
ncbi:MAG: hypothetical protein ACFFAX_09720 [Promethearchaeota archaeon]